MAIESQNHVTDPNPGGSGSGTAAPVARALFDSWLLDYGQADGALLSGVNKVAN